MKLSQRTFGILNRLGEAIGVTRVNHLVSKEQVINTIQNKVNLLKEAKPRGKPFTVVVEGNIGCGKTTMLNYFSNNNDIEIHSEPVNKWRNLMGHNLLDLMYKDPSRWSLTFQTYVQYTMVELHNRIQQSPVKMMERSIYSARYCFVENLFRAGKMPTAEHIVLDQWFQWLIKNTNTNVDLIVYLRTTPEDVYKRIVSRARPEERSIMVPFLATLHELHEEWLVKKYFPVPAPVLILDANLICQAEQTDSQFTLQHFRIFGLQNRLYSDPWYENYLYYVTDRQFINQIKFDDFGFEDSHVVLHIPNECHLTGEYNETIHFTSPHQLVISDGRGTLFLVMTEDRSSSQQWKIVFSTVMEQEKKPFVIVHSRLTTELEIDCLLLNAEDSKDVASRPHHDVKKTPFLTILTWITLATDAVGMWSVKHKRQLAGIGPVEFAALNDNSIMVVSSHQFDFIFDSCKPIEKKEMPVEIKEKAKRYEWNQTETSITITFEVATTFNKDDVTLLVTSTNLNVTTTDGSIALQGELFDKVDPDNSTLTLEDNKLIIKLTKLTVDVLWQSLMNDKLENLMPAQLFDSNPPFDPYQLEECDAFPSDCFNLSMYDSKTHKITARINLSGNQWLFSVTLSPDKLPAFCTRHDVDGLIWQPDDGSSFSHVLTLNALGYVQASKENRKFSTCSPNGAFAIVCDTRRHLYVYHRPVASQIRNRRNGMQNASVARQQVINLDSPDEIIGIHASTNNVFVLTKNTLFAIHVEIDL
uniref:NudC domain-containing protein 1 n=1 Tax=Strigamia maritima TaxID=126957 RepID=T1J4A4_STRMM